MANEYQIINDDKSKPVPIKGELVVATSFSLDPSIFTDGKDISNRLQILIRGIVSYTPVVGSAVSTVIGFFWPNFQDPMEVWNKVKDYVMTLMDELIKKEYIITLEHQLDGIHNNLKDYNDTSYGTSQKGDWFTSVLSSLDNAEPSFFDDRFPEAKLPYFVSLGSIKLAVLREQYLFYEKIYMQSDPDKSTHLKQLRDTINKYQGAATNAKAAALNWRLNKIKLEETTHSIPHKSYTYTVYDYYITDINNIQPSIVGTFDYDPLVGGDAWIKANRCLENYRTKISSETEYLLNVFLGPAYLWKYLDPTNTNTPKKKPVEFISIMAGGLYGSPFSDGPNNPPITKITIIADSMVKGIQIFYGNSPVTHGMSPDQARHEMIFGLELKEGEYFDSAFGRSGDAIDGLIIWTNKPLWGVGKVDTSAGGEPFSASPPAGSDAVLAYISGKVDSKNLTGLTLHYRYWIPD